MDRVRTLQSSSCQKVSKKQRGVNRRRGRRLWNSLETDARHRPVGRPGRGKDIVTIIGVSEGIRLFAHGGEEGCRTRLFRASTGEWSV